MKMFGTILRTFFRSNLSQNSSLVNRRRFVDSSLIKEDIIRLYIYGGTGGNGLARYNGVGGDGGNVFIVGHKRTSFSSLRKCLGGSAKVRAALGEPSSKIKLIGERGKDTIIEVPTGVEAIEAGARILLGRCNAPLTKICLARGGKGGCMENNFVGRAGDKVIVDLDYKLRPNIGLVGFPNAGKSTLMKALVKKKNIEISSTIFTTKIPQVCDLKGFENDDPRTPFSLTVADLPGLIEGASRNRGRGLSFLKHLEYTDIVLMVVDVKGFQLKATLNEPFRSPLDVVALLNIEMESYDQRLVRKPTILALNKVDLIQDQKVVDELIRVLRLQNWSKFVSEKIRPQESIYFDAVLPISAKYNRLENMKEVLKATYDILHPLIAPDYDDDEKTVDSYI